MKGLSFTLFLLVAWLVVLTLLYTKVKSDYIEDRVTVNEMKEMVVEYKGTMEHFVEVYSDKASKELEEYKADTEHSLLVHDQLCEAKIRGIMEEWR